MSLTRDGRPDSPPGTDPLPLSRRLRSVRDRDTSRGERVRARGRDGVLGGVRVLTIGSLCTGYGGLDMASRTAPNSRCLGMG